ncbi:hypothetical protein IAT40_006084 [Kwoniella sp. CBS 6097]
MQFTSILPLFALLPLVASTPLKVRQEVIGLSTGATFDGASVTSAAAADGAAAAASESTTTTTTAAAGAGAGAEAASASTAGETASSAPASDSAAAAPSASAATEGGGDAQAAAPAAAPAGGVDTSNDLTVVKFAALAELLEKTFYETALAKFDAQAFKDAGFVDGQAVFDQLQVISKDEATHLTVLQSVAQSMGSSTADIETCQFNFDAVLGDVNTFLATARLLEFVGIDAYIGGTTLIGDKALLVSAAEIATVEARHNTVLNTFNSGSSVPNTFDMILTPQQVLSVAAPFISGGCDPEAALGLTPTPALTITNTEPAKPGTKLTFGGAGLEGVDQAGLLCNMIVGGATEAISLPIAECTVPDGLDGAVHLFITNSSTPLSLNIVNQDASIIVAGPAVTFIDSIINAQSQILLGTNPNVGATTNAAVGSKKKIVITETIVEEVIA